MELRRVINRLLVQRRLFGEVSARLGANNSQRPMAIKTLRKHPRRMVSSLLIINIFIIAVPVLIIIVLLCRSVGLQKAYVIA
jgi:hypothetical protein